MIKQEVVDKVLDTARIEEVVGDFVPLKKRGTSLIGNCPFHDEKTPSFNVSVAKGIYKCFGCGAGGDSLKFVMEIEKLSYPEAIRYLANKYHIQVEEVERSPEQMAKQDKRESLFVLSKWAGQYFVDQLWDSEEGRSIGLSYFKERGYREDIIRKFALGYSPDKWEALVTAAEQAGFQKEYLKEIGLAIQREDQSMYDRFRGRVIFPIFNVTGRAIGFGGRTLKTEKSVPKYVNSPESEIYHKSDVLYGLNLAKKAISDTDICYLVEGYADVISMHQAGVENVVSSSGTSLTSGQIRLISRYTKNVTILYDGDAAGIKASLRGTDMLLEEGLNVKVLLFPDGHDPDSYVQKFGSAHFKEYIDKHPEDFVFFKTNILLKDSGNDPVKRAEVIRDVVESISLIPDEIKVSLYIRQCSTLLDMEERILLSELNKMRINKSAAKEKKAAASAGDQPPAEFFAAMMGSDEVAAIPQPATTPQSTKLSPEILQERELIRILLNYGNELVTWDPEVENMPIAPYLINNFDDISFEDPASAYIFDVFKKKMATFDIPEAKHFISDQQPGVSDLAVTLIATRYELSPNWNDDKRKIYVTTELDHLKSLVTETVYRLKKRKVERELQKIREELKSPQSAVDLEILMAKYKKYKDMEMMLGEYLGNTIVK
ncbi:DNA primase [Sphingobacterium corticibacter]|uniref:DNA primase n=1 Tax=Sphingobacterium corticibacter TaxID=2171749 RepID=A0A2T8HJJ4_9SPHI|nr:DNA primase [Sphingobacterium corticibacter]PVH25563.1 DNA primase [Sphingobacterium corticibacter]